MSDRRSKAARSRETASDGGRIHRADAPIQSPESKIQNRCPLVLCLSFPLLLTACQSGLFREKEYLARPIPPEKLEQIEVLDLPGQSRTPPLTVEQASDAVLAEIVEPPAPPAQMEVSLADVRAAALANNLDLAVEVYRPDIAQADLDAERAKFEWAFFGSARRSVTDTPVVLGTEGSQGTFDSYEAGLDIPLRTGGFVTFSLPISESSTNNPFSLLNPAFTTDLRFSISQPLLRNAGVNVNTHSIRVARYQQTIATAFTKLEAIRILAAADRRYWSLYASQRELEVRQQQYELAVTQLEQATRRERAGDVAQIEIIRAQSGVAASLEDIIIAQTAAIRTQRDLKRIMNRADLPMNGPTQIVLGTEAAPISLDLDGETLANFAVENRMEMLELELQLAADASAIDFQRNQKLPLVTLDYAYTVNGLGPSYSDAFDQLPNRSFEDWSLGVRAEVPIGNEAAKARYHQAVLIRLQRLATRAQRELAIRQEVFDALDLLQQNWQRIIAARREAIFAGRTLDAERRQFDVGLRTSTDVLEAAARLSDAQSREVLALADYQVAQIDLAFATGTLLGADNVRWEAAE